MQQKFLWRSITLLLQVQGRYCPNPTHPTHHTQPTPPQHEAIRKNVDGQKHKQGRGVKSTQTHGPLQAPPPKSWERTSADRLLLFFPAYFLFASTNLANDTVSWRVAVRPHLLPIHKTCIKRLRLICTYLRQLGYLIRWLDMRAGIGFVARDQRPAFVPGSSRLGWTTGPLILLHFDSLSPGSLPCL